MNTKKDYLSEFEQEWNSDQETTDVLNEEFENVDDEFEVIGDDESDNDNEFEIDDEFENIGEDEITPDNETNPAFTDRLYAVLNGNHESELEFEQDINEVLHEMEKDYFWGGLKKKFRKFKKSGLFATLKKIADKTPLGSTIKQYTALARGDIKGMLKGLAGQALTAMVPGGAVAKQLLNLEVPVSHSNPLKNAQVINTVAKRTYTNLINQMAPINSPNQLNQMRSMGKNAFNRAWGQIGSKSNHTRQIVLKRGERIIIKVI